MGQYITLPYRYILLPTAGFNVIPAAFADDLFNQFSLGQRAMPGNCMIIQPGGHYETISQVSNRA